MSVCTVRSSAPALRYDFDMTFNEVVSGQDPTAPVKIIGYKKKIPYYETNIID